MNKDQKVILFKFLVYSLFGIAFLFLSMTLIIESLSDKAVPPWDTYEFGFKIHPLSAEINQFKLNYDYGTNSGNISFRIESEATERIEISIPHQVDFKGILLMDNKGKKLIKEKDYKSVLGLNSLDGLPYQNFFVIELLNNTQNVDTLLIEIEGRNFYPNGKYIFNHINSARPGNLAAFFQFSKGPFECISNCLFDYDGNLGIIHRGEENLIFLKEVGDSDGSKIDYQWFNLNMLNKDVIFNKQFVTTGSVSVFTAGLILLIEGIILFFGGFLFVGGSKYISKKAKKSLRIKPNSNKAVLQLEYENLKIYTFALFSAILIIGFGVLSNLDKILNNGIALTAFSIGFAIMLIIFFRTHFSMRKCYLKLRELEGGGKISNENPSAGDSIFHILDEMCNLPNDELHTQKTLLEKLNKGKKIDQPYYGIGDDEINLLIEQGYLSYWTPNESEKKYPNYKKAIMATPRAYELIEARKNRVIAQTNIKVAINIGVLVIVLSTFAIMRSLFPNNILSTLLGTLLFGLLAAYYINKTLNKTRVY